MGKRRNDLNYPNWIMDALAVLKPPEKLTVSEWADKYRILSELDSAAPGRWYTAKTPYLRAVMDAFNDDFTHGITFYAGTKLGKTVAEKNMIGYAIAQDPAPMLVVYPSEKLAKFTSEKRLQPMIKLSPALADKFDERGSKDLELSLGTMYIALVGANSPSELSSRPVRYVFFDEIDKFPKWTGAEAGPLELAAERTKTFYNRKIVKVSTPTLKTGNIWQGWETADIQYRYFVPCPHCGEMQTLEFPQIRWATGSDETEARMSAYYECRHCHETIDDRHKPAMLRMGEWRGETKVKGRAHKVAYHLNSIYSPWLTFGDVAAKFLSSKDEPALLMNFINSWLAEPWEDKSSRLKSDVVMEKALPYERGQMPEEAQLLTCGIDVQLDHFWYAVRAWGPHLTSWLVDWGRVETWTDIETVINRNYADVNGVIRNVNLACIDSGYNTDDVYNFCARHMDVLVPTKGSSLPLKSRYNVTILDKRAAGFGLRLYVMDPNQMKNFIASRMAIDAGARGSWNVYRDIEREYADQICAEQRVEQRDKKGRVSIVWEKISSHAANHLLDCETNNTLAAEIMGVRYLMEQEETVRQEAAEETDDWLGVRREWLQQ
ncbi:terminase gpA endonuclease subunit [uncultured Selenomonas sp.]|uniref:phage terminase large subunit family protein n=1 Tax=uncultured Selenomonas sp. TaxID=159275 RepID=UPI0028DB0364|nr:terminase gpA endonuclease subunit [uncultured Selenomonas sp.]